MYRVNGAGCEFSCISVIIISVFLKKCHEIIIYIDQAAIQFNVTSIEWELEFFFSWQ